jgi:hypothetical protein
MPVEDRETMRLEEARNGKAPWKKWWPYLSERQWGTVREDYSDNGDAWSYLSHDQARSRAYRWGEDGLAGISDDKQRLCFALALWNGKDPIIKERCFGLANRGPEDAALHVLPHLWFRNTWSWSEGAPRLELKQAAGPTGMNVIAASHPDLGERFLACAGEPALLFTENETNNERLFNSPNRTPYVKDAINNYLVHGDAQAVNPDAIGTKAAAQYQLTVPAGGEQTIYLRLTDSRPAASGLGADFRKSLGARRQEADKFYAAITPPKMSADEARGLCGSPTRKSSA